VRSLAHGAPIEIGAVLDGRYRIDAILGAGGMGVVYRAEHLALRQTVAIKMPLLGVTAQSETVQRLLREARAAVRLRSPHVCRVIDVGSTPAGLPYLVLEHLEGIVLSAYLRRKTTLSFDQTWRFLLETCEAVGEAHGLGIVHRDLKPANLFLVTDRHGRRSIKVLDFGISKVTDPEAFEPRLTESSVLMGSPSYIAPEQMADTRSVDARADVWALGVCAYELVTGKLPFKGSSVMDLAVRIAMNEAVPPGSLRSDTPPALEAIILRCLSKAPEDRYASAVELGAALGAAAPPDIARSFVGTDLKDSHAPSALSKAADTIPFADDDSLPATSATVTAAVAAAERLLPSTVIQPAAPTPRGNAPVAANALPATPATPATPASAPDGTLASSPGIPALESARDVSAAAAGERIVSPQRRGWSRGALVALAATATVAVVGASLLATGGKSVGATPPTSPSAASEARTPPPPAVTAPAPLRTQLPNAPTPSEANGSSAPSTSSSSATPAAAAAAAERVVAASAAQPAAGTRRPPPPRASASQRGPNVPAVPGSGNGSAPRPSGSGIDDAIPRTR
jgi:serine/threonine protein kinase